MAKSHAFFSGQHWLFSIIRELGYQPKQRGLCLGIAYMGMQAMLDDRVSDFDNIIMQLSEIDPWQFRQQLKNAVSSHPMCFFYREADETAAMKSFLEGAQFYNLTQKKILAEADPRKYANLRGNRENITSVRIINGNYSIKRMEKFFGSFRHAYIHSLSSAPVVLLLTAKQHAIAISYNPYQDVWQLINASSLPSKTLHTDQELVQNIKRAFRMHDPEEQITLKTRIFTRPFYYQEANDIVTHWRKKFKSQLSHHKPHLKLSTPCG